MENQRWVEGQGGGYPAMLNNGGGGIMVGMDDFHAFRVPPGYRFCPTDEELIEDYLKQKLRGLELSYQISEVNIYDYHPKQLFEKYNKEEEQEQELYFFTPRGKRYPRGSRPSRSAKHGSWKPTGDCKAVRHKETGITLGLKRSLKFFWAIGDKLKPTPWLMHEYTLDDEKNTSKNSARAAKNQKASDNMKLDEWVLVRIYIKRGASKNESDEANDVEAHILPFPPSPPLQEAAALRIGDQKQETYCSPMTQPIPFPTNTPHRGFGQGFCSKVFHENHNHKFNFPLSETPDNQYLPPWSLPPPPLPLPPLVGQNEAVLSELCDDFSYLFDESLMTNRQIDFQGCQFFQTVQNGLDVENQQFDGSYYANTKVELPVNNNGANSVVFTSSSTDHTQTTTEDGDLDALGDYSLRNFAVNDRQMMMFGGQPAVGANGIRFKSFSF